MSLAADVPAYRKKTDLLIFEMNATGAVPGEYLSHMKSVIDRKCLHLRPKKDVESARAYGNMMTDLIINVQANIDYYTEAKNRQDTQADAELLRSVTDQLRPFIRVRDLAKQHCRDNL